LFELAHERLIDSWPMLAEGLSRTADYRAMHARLEAAVANWERLDHASEALWRERQLADIATLPASELSAPESQFVTASQRAVRRRRRLRLAAFIAVPLLIGSFVVGARVHAHRNVAQAIEARVRDADRELAAARSASPALL
jgi:hypothetical protein